MNIILRVGKEKMKMEGLVNVMEESVLHKIDQIWKTTDYCKCDKCRLDIAAYALNRRPPR